MAPGPETRLVDRMRKAAQKIYQDRIVIIKYHGNRFTQAGVSDLLVCLDGNFIAVEVKAPESYGGNEDKAREEGPSLKQRGFIARVKQAGGDATVCVTVEEFLETLAQVAQREESKSND